MFEVKYRDAAGRIGILYVGDKRVETPFLFPVVNPKKLIITPKEIEREFKIPVLMTNAYLIYKDPELRKKFLEEGIHRALNFNGVIETDSGSYQILHYKKEIEVSNKEIIEFQVKIGSDIINVLDIPTDVDVSYEKASEDLKITIGRIKEGISIAKSLGFNGLINGAVQGGVYEVLRKKSAEIVKNLDVNIFAIGTIVPYMISYDFKSLFKVIMYSRVLLPFDKPVHLFGLGHPLIIPLAVSIGADIFDSASYALYAYDNRYMTPFGTIKLEKLFEFPCSCPICSKYTVNEIKSLNKDERIKLVAKHNLWVLEQEIKAVKQAIREGSLWELVILKAHSHPGVYKATRFVLEKYYNWLKHLDPIRKPSGILWQSELTDLRPDVRRALERLKERLDPEDYEYLYKYTWPFSQMVK